MKQNKPDGRCATCPRWDTDGTSGYPAPKTSRRSSSYTEGRGQRQNQTSSELAYWMKALRSSSRIDQ